MSEFRLYNTLTRTTEPFAPADGETVLMYTCGPTVYNPAHLGNFRTFLFEDLMRRVLALRGWQVQQVMNLTDVDDKIIRRAFEQGKTITEVTEPVIEIFHRDREYLRIQRAEAYPRATEFIPQMIALVQRKRCDVRPPRSPTTRHGPTLSSTRRGSRASRSCRAHPSRCGRWRAWIPIAATTLPATSGAASRRSSTARASSPSPDVALRDPR